MSSSYISLLNENIFSGNIIVESLTMNGDIDLENNNIVNGNNISTSTITLAGNDVGTQLSTLNNKTQFQSSFTDYPPSSVTLFNDTVRSKNVSWLSSDGLGTLNIDHTGMLLIVNKLNYVDISTTSDFKITSSTTQVTDLSILGMTGGFLKAGITGHISSSNIQETDVYGLTGDINNLYTGITSINNRTVSLETGVTSLNVRTSSLETGVTSLNVRTASLETGVTSLNVRTSSLETGVTSLNVRTVSLEAGVTSLNVRTASLETGVTSLNVRMTAAETGITADTYAISLLQTQCQYLSTSNGKVIHDWSPNNNYTYNLGASLNAWNNMYCSDVIYNGTTLSSALYSINSGLTSHSTSINNLNAGWTSINTGLTSISGSVTTLQSQCQNFNTLGQLSSSLIPSIANTYNVGSAANPLSYLYTQSLVLNGSGLNSRLVADESGITSSVKYTGSTTGVNLGSYGITCGSLKIGSLSGYLKGSAGVVGITSIVEADVSGLVSDLAACTKNVGNTVNVNLGLYGITCSTAQIGSLSGFLYGTTGAISTKTIVEGDVINLTTDLNQRVLYSGNTNGLNMSGYGITCSTISGCTSIDNASNTLTLGPNSTAVIIPSYSYFYATFVGSTYQFSATNTWSIPVIAATQQYNVGFTYGTTGIYIACNTIKPSSSRSRLYKIDIILSFTVSSSTNISLSLGNILSPGSSWTEGSTTNNHTLNYSCITSMSSSSSSIYPVVLCTPNPCFLYTNYGSITIESLPT